MTSHSKQQHFVRSDGWNMCNSWGPATKITLIKNSDSVYTHFIRFVIFVTDSPFTTRNSITARCWNAHHHTIPFWQLPAHAQKTSYFAALQWQLEHSILSEKKSLDISCWISKEIVTTFLGNILIFCFIFSENMTEDEITNVYLCVTTVRKKSFLASVPIQRINR
jgi:hypothetical protein